MNTKSSLSPTGKRLSATGSTEFEVANHLLTASGVLAISLVAVLSGMQFGFLPQLIVFAVFTIIFVGLTYKDRLNLTNQQGVLGIVSLFLLSVLSWFIAPTDLVLILTVVMMAEAPYIVSRRRCWQLMALTNLAYLLVFYLFWDNEYVFLSWVSMFALQAFATTSSLARVQEAQLKQMLFEQNSELVEARSALARKCQMEERLRIAGDLHDSIGHQLTALRLQLEAVAQVVPTDIKPIVAVSQKLSLELLDNIRSIVKRMSQDEHTNLITLIKQIDRDTPGVTITLTTPVPVIETELLVQLIHCLKEGVSNAIRHSNADIIDISFAGDRVQITDNGKGLAEGHTIGFGLTSIQQRLASFGGDIELNDLKPSGCQLSMKLASGLSWEKSH
jgi:signal transduction histidine kinase